MARKTESAAPRLRLVPKDRWEDLVPSNEVQLTKEMFQAWKMRRCGAKHHQVSSYERDVDIIIDFMRFSKKVPWRWTPDDFDQWCGDLALVRGVTSSSERSYQTAIRLFLEYATENVRFRDEVKTKFGVAFVQICNEDNCIPHAVDNDQAAPRRSLSHSEMQLVFTKLDATILEAARFRTKSLRPLQRDKAYFSSMYAYGTRISEHNRIDTYHWLENPHFPEFGRFGRVQVFGKGANGSGLRQRIVDTDERHLPPILQWYADHVRPKLLLEGDPNEVAFFLTERGKRCTRAGMERRFDNLLKLAGIPKVGLVTHSLRHTMTTHESMRTSPVVAQHKNGHAHLSTTQGYTHYPNSHIKDQVTRSIRAQLDEPKRPPQSGNADDGGDA